MVGHAEDPRDPVRAERIEAAAVYEVIDTARRVTGREIAVRYDARRFGDPARLVADSRLARQVLGWQPKRNDLEPIIADAWAWEQKWPWGPAA